MSTSTPTPCRAGTSPATVTWADPARQQRFDAWLRHLAPQYGLAVHTLRPASADASFRRYLRVQAQDCGDAATASARSFIIMDAPPNLEDCRPFVRVQALMHEAGLHVPHIFAWDEAAGFMLLSDVGQRTLLQYLDPGDPQTAQLWYRHAADTLLQWQRASRPGVLPAYDDALLRRELQLFPDWYIARHRGQTLGAEDAQTLQTAFDAIVAHNLAVPSVYVHRDFMTRNLMLPATGASLTQPLAVLDFQDAVYGPVTYDIASLLCDAFISWDEEFVIDVTVRYWEKARACALVGAASASGWGADFGEFYRAVQWMGLQRHLKVAGIFARLTLRDGKPQYLADTPRFIRYIRQTCSRYRELTPLLRLIDRIEGIEPSYGYAYGRL